MPFCSLHLVLPFPSKGHWGSERLHHLPLFPDRMSVPPGIQPTGLSPQPLLLGRVLHCIWFPGSALLLSAPLYSELQSSLVTHIAQSSSFLLSCLSHVSPLLWKHLHTHFIPFLPPQQWSQPPEILPMEVRGCLLVTLTLDLYSSSSMKAQLSPPPAWMDMSSAPLVTCGHLVYTSVATARIKTLCLKVAAEITLTVFRVQRRWFQAAGRNLERLSGWISVFFTSSHTRQTEWPLFMSSTHWEKCPHAFPQ